MELWDLYTENFVKTSYTHVRGEELPDDLYHLVCHVWIRNSKNQWLISQRASWRSSYPLMWECVGGSILSGESGVDGAIREVKEEVGIDLTDDMLKPVFMQVRKEVNGLKFNDILQVWVVDYDGHVDLNNATTDEVEQVRWLYFDEVQKLFNSGEFVFSLDYFFDVFNNS